jgi:hypothetical protein
LLSILLFCSSYFLFFLFSAFLTVISSSVLFVVLLDFRLVARWLIIVIIILSAKRSECAMARYKKTYDGERRTRRRVILLTPAEDEQLEKAAAKSGTQFSEHVRELCLRRSAAAKVIAGTRRSPQTRDLVRELTAIGNNLNQLAKRAHTSGQLPLRIELDHTTRLLKEAFARVLAL